MGRWKRRAFGRAPSREEFEAVLHAELDFLVGEHGFTRSASPVDPWRVEFRRERCCIALTGGGYGQNASLDIEIDGAPFAWFEVCPDYATRLTPPSDSPQLDDVREAAFRLRQHLAPLLHGDFALVEAARRIQQQREAEREARRAADPRGTFFSQADALWKNKRWAAFVSHLEGSPHSLTQTWQGRLVAAKARAK